jgi:NADH pyrophosphatase NudC (nudix superfamily)
MSILFRCPGGQGGATPTIQVKRCPQCGGEVELFSTDMKVDCPACGQTVFNNVNSCVDYCQYAEQCLGRDTYLRLRQRNKQALEARDGKSFNQDQS